MKIKKTFKISRLERDEFLKRMRLDRLYYHCCSCGKIYEDKHHNLFIVDLSLLNGSNSIPYELNDFLITSTFCKKCYQRKKEYIKERKNHR